MGQTLRSADGIAVGEPKLFDNRSLALMLESLQEALKNANGSVVDRKALKDSMGLLQGYQQSDVSRSLDISTPGAKNATTVPAASASTIPSVGNKVGIGSEDLLTQQVDLTYQIVNLQLLLERAESDRYWSMQKPAHSGARMQAVLGFQVSVNPPPKYKGCAAVVELTVVPEQGSGQAGDVSLVALMPQEKTYNAATLATRSNSFSGAAVVKIVTIGYSESHRGSKLYLYQDSDTVAFERPKDNTGAVTFGWQFRPVLDRPSVDPGVRQLFAVVALPNTDLYHADLSQASKVKITAKTYWVKYDRKHRVAAEHQLGKETGGYPGRELTALSGSFISEELSPTVKAVSWHPVGPEEVLVDVQGDNLFQGSSVLLGGAVIDRNSPALVLNSDQHLQVLTTASVLAHSDGVVSGRYGVPTPLMPGAYMSRAELATANLPATAKILKNWCAEEPELLGKGIEIERLRAVSYPGENLTTIEIDLVSKLEGDTAVPNLCNQQPLLTVGDETIRANIVQYPSQYEKQKLGANGKPVLDSSGHPQMELHNVLRLVARVPNELLAREQLVTAKVPFLGDTYQSSGVVYPTSTANKVIQTIDGDIVTFAVEGTDFNRATQVLADKPYKVNDTDLTLVGTTVLLLKLPRDKAKVIKHLIVVTAHREPIVLPLSAEPPKTAKPALAAQHLVTQQNSAVGLKIQGTNLSAIAKITFEGKSLEVSKADDGKSVTVYLTREMTRVAGVSFDLLLHADAGTVLAAQVEVVKALTTAARPK